MARDRRDRTALSRMHRRDAHIVGRHLAQHRFLAAVGLGAKRCAFEYLSQIIGVALGKAVMDRRRGKHAAVAAAAADDDVGAALQQSDERMHAGHRNDSFSRIELGFREGDVRVEPIDRRAVAHSPAQILLVDFRVEIADVETGKPMLCGKLLDDFDVEVDTAVRARVA